MQNVVPMLAYEDGVAAMKWLATAFDLTIKEQWLDDDGRLSFGELVHGEESILVASPTADYQSPKTLRENYPPAAKWQEIPYILHGVLLYVDDVDAALQRAQDAGAKIPGPMEDGFPGRRFRAEDLEGHRRFPNHRALESPNANRAKQRLHGVRSNR